MVFIPMYNCENQIIRVLEKFDSQIQQLFCEVIVIDNRSNDKSVDIAKSALASLKDVKTTLMLNDENYSLGGSIKVAFNYAIDNQYDYIITLHGDDQGDIRDIVSLVESSSLKDHDIIIGARFHSRSELIGYSKFRIYGNIVVNALCSFVTGLKIYDMVAGLNIFKTDFLEDRFYLQFPNNLTFDAHLLLYAIKEQRKVKYVPITWKEEDQVSNAKVIKQGFTLLKLFYMYFRDKESIFIDGENEFSTKTYTYQILYQSM